MSLSAAGSGQRAQAATADRPRPVAQASDTAAGRTGLVLSIQRFSTHDGPGVRTTVFFKGCTNACAWCHNPESIGRRPELQFFAERCLQCGRCAAVCPQAVHALRAGVHELHRERCLACGRCVAECFAGALELAGRRMVAADVLAQIVADAPYYRHSGGGATFSGGEPLLQREFLTCLLAGCRERGVHTAVETAGNYPWEWLAGALPLIDLVMYDIKVLDPGLHARHVGNDGRRSRANYRRLAASGKPLIVRTPVVGGVNDTPEHIGAIARFVAAHGEVLYFELLPYHALGDAKRQSLGRPPAAGFGTPSSAALAALAAAARAHVSRVRP